MLVRLRRIATLCLSLAPLVILQYSVEASATNFGSKACGGTPRNCVNLLASAAGSASMGFYQVATGFRDAVLNRVSYSYPPLATDVEFVDVGNVTPSQGVLVLEVTNPATTVVAWVDCYVGSSGVDPYRTCQVSALYVNDDNTNTSTSGNVSYPRGVACHELGHTIGLRHTSGDTCLYNPASALRLSTVQHDRDHSKAFYQ
jgi:hypothetical protein